MCTTNFTYIDGSTTTTNATSTPNYQSKQNTFTNNTPTVHHFHPLQSTSSLTSTQVKMKSNGRSSTSNSSSSSSGSSSKKVSKQDDLVRYQRAVFTALFLGYACYTYNRKSVSYATPTLLASGLITTSNLGTYLRHT